MWKNGNNNNEISDGVSVLLVIYTDWKKNQTIENILLTFCGRVLLLLLINWKDFKTFRQSVRKI